MHNVNLQRREIQVGSRTLTLETGKLAKQAHGAVIVRSGDTMVLVAASRAASPRDVDFLPLTVDYREYAYASGRIPGGFFKREGKAAEKEILTSRLIDRPIRPLFPSGWRFETQIIALVMSADSENDADVLAITGASAALAISEIPFEKTVAGVRVGMVNNEYVINPTYSERKQSTLDLIVAGTKDGIVMVEAGAREVSEAHVVGGLEAAHAAIKKIIAGIDELKDAVGKKKVAVAAKAIAPEFYQQVEKKALGPLTEAMRIKQKLESYGQVDTVLDELLASLPEGDRAAEEGRRAHLSRAPGKGHARRGARARRPPRRPQVRRDPPDLDRDRHPPTRARLGRLHARRDAGTGQLHARHCRRPAEDRARHRRAVSPLHAPLQLPAVLGR